jgi:hypothetical protein
VAWGGVEVRRRRSWRLVLLAAVTLALAAVMLALTGCGNPAGVDGDLTNNWPAMPEPKLPEPVDHACYDVATDDPAGVARWPPPVDCTASHTVETIHIGAFRGDDATRETPPPAGSPARRNAYGACSTVAATFLGGDWRTGRLALVLNTPIALHWEAGARWFRCDVVEYQDLDTFDVVSRTASLQGALAGARLPPLTCFNVVIRNGSVDAMPAAACTSPHDAEFAGIYDAPDGPWVSDDKQREDAFSTGCYAVIAKFTGVPNDGNLRARTGNITAAFGRSDWELGNRGTRCFLLPGEKHSRSLRGVGPSGLPVHYR